MEERIVVIDTDAGVDDTLAILIALRAHKEPTIPWKIVGITCVNGNTGLANVCVNVTRIFDIVGTTDIPIYSGATKGIVHEIPKRWVMYHGEDGFGDTDLPRVPPKLEKEPAALALIRLAHQYEGKLTVIALGPLTNIAMAINLDPTFSKSLKELCVMGGNVYGIGNIQATAEFNFWADPESAHVTLGAPYQHQIFVVPWETCKFEAKFTLDWRLNIMGKINTPESKLMNKIEEIILQRNEKIHLGWVSCDAMVPAIMLNPKIIKTKESHFCRVELNGSHTRGQMVLDHPKISGEPDNVIAVTKVHLEEYEKMILWGLYAENTTF